MFCILSSLQSSHHPADMKAEGNAEKEGTFYADIK